MCEGCVRFPLQTFFSHGHPYIERGEV
jgi:hypothetical protein